MLHMSICCKVAWRQRLTTPTLDTSRAAALSTGKWQLISTALWNYPKMRKVSEPDLNTGRTFCLFTINLSPQTERKETLSTF